MGYRKEDIPGMIRALEATRQQPMGSGVCWALECAWEAGHITLGEMNAAKGLVVSSLKGHIWLGGWIYETQGFAPWARMGRIRRRWVEKMISDLKEYAK